MLRGIIAASLLIFISLQSFASQRNDFPSCYDAYKIDKVKMDDVAGRELFVVIDGTFDPDDILKQSVHDNVHQFVRLGDRFNIVSFSAYLQNNYTKLKIAGQIEQVMAPDSRDGISKPILQKFDICMRRQQEFARKSIDEAIISSFKPADVEVPSSEIVGSFAQAISTLISDSPARKKVILIVSDMLENSDITSFYRANTLRLIDPQNELSKITDADMLAQFSGADVYVIGGGWVPEKYRNNLRGSKKMKLLKDFWGLYFEQSGATLVEFGSPILMGKIR